MSGMKKIFLIMGIGMMAALAGCAGKDNDPAGQAVENIVSEDEISDVEIPESNSARNEISESNLSENGVSENEEINDISETEVMNIQEEIINGDFSCMNDDDREYMEYYYPLWQEVGMELEWRIIDLNGDGIDDVILQNVQATTPERPWKPILLIIACKEDSARCIMRDLSDISEFTFCGSTGELIYYSDAWGMSIAFESYRHCYYDSSWHRITDYRLVGTVIDSSIDGGWEKFLEYHPNWLEENPNMDKDGYYYSIIPVDLETGEDMEREFMSYEEFKEIFEEAMGIEYNGLSYPER